MVFWIYSGCLISFFTFSPSGSPINFVRDFKNSDLTFYTTPGRLASIRKALNEETIPESIKVINGMGRVLKDMAIGTEGIGAIHESHIFPHLISLSN